MNSLRRSAGVHLAAVTAILMLSACTIDTAADTIGPNGGTVPSWTPPLDGVWDASAPNRVTGFGEEFVLQAAFHDIYSGALQTAPSFSAHEGNEVTMQQEASFTRIGLWEGAMELPEYGVRFIPGRDEPEEGIYSYNGTVTCEQSIPNIGDSTQCTLSVRAKLSDVQNSSWLMGNISLAAWPGQPTISG